MFIGRVWAEVLNLRAGNVGGATSALMFGPTKLEQLFGCDSAPGGTRGKHIANAKSKHYVPCAAAAVTACKRQVGGVTLGPRVKQQKTQSIASSKGQMRKPTVLRIRIP